MPTQGYWDAEFAPWAAGMRRIGSMIAAQPMMQANAQARQRDAELMAARTQTEGAQQGKLRAETSAIEQDTGGRNKLGDALRRLSANPKDPSALADAFEGTAQALRHDPEGTSKALGTLLGQMKALGGDVKGGADVTDPVAMEKNRGDNASRESIAGSRMMTVQPGGALVDPRDPSKAVFSNPSAASQAQAEYEETSTEYPEVVATEKDVVTTTPGKKNFAMGMDWLAKDDPAINTTNKVTTPYQPKRTVKTRRRIGDAADAPMANQAQPEDDSEMPTSEDEQSPGVHGSNEAAPAEAPVASAPSFAEKVRVVHPDGRTGLIPKAQLQAAMAQGYKLAQ